MSLLRSLCSTAALLWVFAVLNPVAAITSVAIDFDTAAALKNNFWSQVERTEVEWNSGGYIQKGQDLFATNTLIYNSNSSGGVEANTAGTTTGAPLNKFLSFTISVDIQESVFGAGNTVGFYTGLNDDATSGYLVYMSFENNSGNSEVRMRSGANPSVAGGIGGSSSTPLGGSFGPSSLFETDTPYTFKLDVEDDGFVVRFNASVWTTDATPTQVGSTVSHFLFDDMTGTPGQVGLRLSSVSSDILLDNFTVTPVPEPSAHALFTSALIGLVMLLRWRQTPEIKDLRG